MRGTDVLTLCWTDLTASHCLSLSQSIVSCGGTHRTIVRDTQLPAQCVVVQNYSNQNNVFHFRYTREHGMIAVSTRIHTGTMCFSFGMVQYQRRYTKDTMSPILRAAGGGAMKQRIPRCTHIVSEPKQCFTSPSPQSPYPSIPQGDVDYEIILRRGQNSVASGVGRMTVENWR